MENYSEMIDEVIDGLNWDLIMNFYESDDFIEPKKKKNLKNKDLMKSNVSTKNTIKQELKNLITFVIESNAKELHHDQWIIFWRSEDEEKTRLGNRLEVVFVPTRSVSFENSIKNPVIVDDNQPDIDEMERATLKELLAKSIKEENYELSAIIHSRLKKLNKNKPK